MEPTMRHRCLGLALLTALLFSCPGCGSGNNIWVTGKLLKGGTQYSPPKDQLVSVTFVALEVQDESGKTVKSGEPYLAELDQSSGTFSVPGPERQGIPPGKYRVAVTQRLTREAFGALKQRPKKGVDRETDTLENKFGVTTSPIIVEVKKSEEVTIDLDRPTGSSSP
jgi:hypothetical protein